MTPPRPMTRRGPLEAAAGRLSRPSVRAVIEGPADQVIGDYMKECRDAMLVMGAYGHAPLRTLIVGSTTTTMVRTVRRPVLLVR